MDRKQFLKLAGVGSAGVTLSGGGILNGYAIFTCCRPCECNDRCQYDPKSWM